MQVTISMPIQELAKLLQKAQNYTKSENLKEKLDFDSDKQELVRECLEDDHYYSLENMLNLTSRELGKVLRTISHLIGMQVESVAFVNEFDSDGQAYAMVHLGVIINLK